MRHNKEVFPFFNARNYSFFSRLHSRFYIEVIEQTNQTPSGNWYYCKIKGQNLHILSKVPLSIQAIYLVEKVSPLEIQVVEKIKKDKKLSNDNISFIA